MGSGDVNFDKVFSVPQAPGTDRAPNNQNIEVIADNNPNKSTESSDSSIDEQKDSDEKEGRLSFLLVLWSILPINNLYI